MTIKSDYEIEDSVMTNEHSEPLPLSPEQRNELIRRIRDLDADPDSAIPWEVVRERLWNRIHKR